MLLARLFDSWGRKQMIMLLSSLGSAVSPHGSPHPRRDRGAGGGERTERFEAIGLNGIDPCGDMAGVAGPLLDHSGKRCDVADGDVQVPTAVRSLFRRAASGGPAGLADQRFSRQLGAPSAAPAAVTAPASVAGGLSACLFVAVTTLANGVTWLKSSCQAGRLSVYSGVEALVRCFDDWIAE